MNTPTLSAEPMDDFEPNSAQPTEDDFLIAPVSVQPIVDDLLLAPNFVQLTMEALQQLPPKAIKPPIDESVQLIESLKHFVQELESLTFDVQPPIEVIQYLEDDNQDYTGAVQVPVDLVQKPTKDARNPIKTAFPVPEESSKKFPTEHDAPTGPFLNDPSWKPQKFHVNMETVCEQERYRDIGYGDNSDGVHLVSNYLPNDVLAKNEDESMVYAQSIGKRMQLMSSKTTSLAMGKINRVLDSVDTFKPKKSHLSSLCRRQKPKISKSEKEAWAAASIGLHQIWGHYSSNSSMSCNSSCSDTSSDY